ncbi:MAG TPA: ABC transporter permease subunit [Vicinamibacteria bacterium]|nr:ABC transporter permease subunit [Vicinamibacteria bacterium]
MRLWSAERLRRASPLDGLAVVAVALVVLVVFLDEPHVLPRMGAALNLSPLMLPLYAGYSLLRMLAAYVLALGFALGAGHWASASPLGRRLILPSLDVLQAVPILGFFPAAIFFFIRLFRGSALGVEAAAVFLIFTSQAWNMAFSVYESLTTIPDDLRTAAQVSGLSGAVLWRRLLLPACVPRLVYNSMLSWAGGWYFLIASEIIAVGRRSWVLPGLGSYIGESITLGRHGLAAAGLVSLVGVIVLLNVLVWSPLESWSERFRYETNAGETTATPLARRLLRRAPLVRGGLVRLGRRAGGLGARVVALASHAVSHPWTRPLFALAAVGGLAALGYGAVQTVEVLLRPLPAEAAAIPAALFLSFLRLLLAYAISLAWTIPVACWVSRSAVRAGRLMPVVQVLASVPATAFFPVLVAIVLWLHLDLNVSAVALVLTGMQWYLLFNLVAAAQAMPEDVRELARATGARGFFYLRRFFLPAALPSLITGSLTAWGGGWNALVLSESVTAAGRTWSVHGIGTLLDQATYVKGDLQMIMLVIVAMVSAVLLLNRAVWRPLYAWASVRYRFDG